MELVRHLNCHQDWLKVIKEIKLGWKSIRNTWKGEHWFFIIAHLSGHL